MEDSKTKVVSSWGVHKKLQKVYDKVRKRIPAVGEVEDKKKNPKLNLKKLTRQFPKFLIGVSI